MTHRNLTCAELEGALADFLEGSLDDSSVADVELHLAACGACRTLVADLQQIAVDARSLPSPTPTRDLWPGIAARIEAGVVPLSPRVVRLYPKRWLAAAAAVLVAATSLVTYEIARRGPTGVTAATARDAQRGNDIPDSSPRAANPEVAAVPASRPSLLPPPVLAVEASRTPEGTRETLDAEITRLRSILEVPNNRLDPATLAVIELSLRVIDSAIVEARSALSADPASPFLRNQLDNSLERKLGLLRKAALLAPRT
jgi:hypothetical protein